MIHPSRRPRHQECQHQEAAVELPVTRRNLRPRTMTYWEMKEGQLSHTTTTKCHCCFFRSNGNVGGISSRGARRRGLIFLAAHSVTFLRNGNSNHYMYTSVREIASRKEFKHQHVLMILSC